MSAGPGFDIEPFSDAELTELALAADPGVPLDPGAVPIDIYLGTTHRALPEWYMAPAMARVSGRCRRLVIMAVVGAFLLIEAFGLCSTYGQLPFVH
ncbi:MAG TPA: hypothetical protein VK386_03175 [Acidimicrobiales bacterium]|nr:hypothetical protein [Acidimicrobiales bacterium]